MALNLGHAGCPELGCGYGGDPRLVHGRWRRLGRRYDGRGRRRRGCGGRGSGVPGYAGGLDRAGFFT
ncbi:hypothetical protein GCM10009730_50550 [Streptomyces albidochromogenes]